MTKKKTPSKPKKPAKQKSGGGCPGATCSPLTDFEKRPWSYDLYADGLEPVVLLNNPDHSQGEWVTLAQYRKAECTALNALNLARTALETVEHIYGHAQHCDECQSFEIAKECRDMTHGLDCLSQFSLENAKVEARRP
jgi:hypothetical protein